MSATPADWEAARRTYRLTILWNAETHMLCTIASSLICEQAAEIERLKGELDRYQGRAVLHCTEAAMDTAAMSSLDEADGTIIRATDTGRELVLIDHTWIAR